MNSSKFKDVIDMKLVVNPSINVSPFCYSIFRVEPYSTCTHACVYCFGRWYRIRDYIQNKPLYDFINEFKLTIKKLKRLNLKSIPFRLSTLVDPFQPIEKEYRLSRYVMRLCHKFDMPLIINTKAVMLMEDNYLQVLKKLHDKEIVIVQVSLSTINEKIAKVIEPNAPSPYERLKMCERLSSEGVPVIVRLQPFIPGITDFEIEEIIKQCKYVDVKQIIVEALRDEVENLKVFKEVAYDKSMYESSDKWTSYSPSVQLPTRIVRPCSEWKLRIFEKVKELCIKYGIEFSTCKEGFYHLHTAKNCCGMHFMSQNKYVLRLTLQEVWNYYNKYGRLPRFEELTHELDEIMYIYDSKLRNYPRNLRRGLIHHEKILRRILNEKVNMFLGRC